MFQDNDTLRSFIFISLLGFLGIIVLLNPAPGQEQEKPVTYRILGISVEGNNPRTGTESGAIIANSGLKVGDQITIPGDQVRQAILRLWALHIFSDVQVLTDRKVGDGVYLLIKVKEYPRLERVDISGTDDVSEDDLRKEIHLTNGQILTPEEIKTAEQNIKRKYEEEGHLLATIKSETEPVDSSTSSKVILRFNIDEGPSVTIDHVYFKGNSAISEGDLKGQMEDIHEKSWWQIFSHPRFDKKKFEQDKERVLKYYRNNGYLDAEIVSDSTWYTPDKKHIDVLVNVREGQQYKIRSITWEGNTVYSSTVLGEQLGVTPGMVYDEEKFQQGLYGNPGNPDQPNVASLYLDNGYLKFNLIPEIDRVGNDSLDITVRVYERNQFRIGHVDIKGNRKTKDNVIRRELYTIPGRYFSRADIYRSLRQLQQLNYFNPEKLRPDTRIVDDQTVDLIYEVEEKSSDNVNASVGYSGAFGVTGALGFTINNFSLADPFEGGAGQILNFDWQFGEASRFRTFSLGFTEPWLFDHPTTLGFTLFDTRQQYIYDLQQTGLSVRLGRRFTWPDNYVRGDWTATFQRNDVRDNAGSPYYQIGKTTQISLQQIFSRNSTDNPIFPAQGSSLSLSTEISGKPFLPGNVSYHKWLFNGEWYTPLLGTNRVVLYTGSQFGYIDGIGSQPNIPPIATFFMGGTGLGYVATTPLRGYEDQMIGPINPQTQQPLGGRVLTKQTAELRLAITLNPIPIYVLGFAEGGNVFQDFRHADFFDLKRSFGFGARLLIQPIGMVGFDEGYGVDDVFPRDGKPDGWHFHFQFGRGF